MLYYGWVQLAWINSSRQFDFVCKNNLFWSFSNSQKKEEERKGKRANRERQGCRGSQTLCQWCRDMEEMERRIQMKQTERKPDKTLEGKQKEQAGAAAAFGQRGRTKYMPITVFAWRELFPHKISSCNCTLYAFVHSLKVYTTYSACTVLQSLLWHPTCNYILWSSSVLPLCICFITFYIVKISITHIESMSQVWLLRTIQCSTLAWDKD